LKPSYMNLFFIENGDIVQMDDFIAAMNNDRASVTTDVYIRNTVASIYTDGDSGSVSYYRLDIMVDGIPVKSVRLDGGETQFDLAKVGPELPMQYYDIKVTAYSKYGRVMGTARPAPWFNGTSLPKCEPMTLRFRFSKADYIPNTAKGTWTKVEPCADNIWDWTYTNPDWIGCFNNVFKTDDNIVDVVDAGDTTEVTRVAGLFAGSNKNDNLTYSYVRNVCWFETKNVYSAMSMFAYCKLLTYVPYYNLDSATNIKQMMYRCESLEYFPRMDTSHVEQMDSLFSLCTSLKEVSLLDTTNVTSMASMFTNCSSLETVPQFDTSNVTSMASMFSTCSSLKTVPKFDTSNVTTMKSMFANCRSLETVPKFDTSNVTTMEYMFANCNSLKAVPQFDTSNVTTMAYMFANCSSLKTVPQFDTSSVTTMAYMFSQCSELEYVPPMDTSNCTSFGCIFTSCSSLKSAPSFDTSKSTLMNEMFQHCHSLESVGTYDASSATTIERMYFCCPKLKRVNYMPIKENCNMYRAFDTLVEGTGQDYGSSLEEIPNWDFSKASNLEKVFRGCTCLKDIPDMGVPVNATTCSEMFRGCANIETGMARAYANLSAGPNMDTHDDVFTDCGTATAGGMADRASIPVSWGGDQE